MFGLLLVKWRWCVVCFSWQSTPLGIKRWHYTILAFLLKLYTEQTIWMISHRPHPISAQNLPDHPIPNNSDFLTSSRYETLSGPSENIRKIYFPADGCATSRLIFASFRNRILTLSSPWSSVERLFSTLWVDFHINHQAIKHLKDAWNSVSVSYKPVSQTYIPTTLSWPKVPDPIWPNVH